MMEILNSLEEIKKKTNFRGKNQITAHRQNAR